MLRGTIKEENGVMIVEHCGGGINYDNGVTNEMYNKERNTPIKVY